MQRKTQRRHERLYTFLEEHLWRAADSSIIIIMSEDGPSVKIKEEEEGEKKKKNPQKQRCQVAEITSFWW